MTAFWMDKRFSLQNILGLALAYGILAWLSSLFIRAPLYSMPFWLPAGLAVTAIIRGGIRLWPGLWLGSFIFEFWLFNKSLPDAMLTAMITAAGLAAAMVMQALTAERLLRPLLKATENTPDIPKILRILLLLAPVACLVFATFGTLILYAVNDIPPEDLWANGLTWYAGDTLGVLTCAPAALLSQQFWRQFTARFHVFTIALPMLFAACVLGIGLYFFGQYQAQTTRNEFKAKIEALATNLKLKLVLAEQQLRAISGLINGSENVEEAEFVAFNDNAGLMSGIRFYAWLPRESTITAIENLPVRLVYPEDYLKTLTQVNNYFGYFPQEALNAARTMGQSILVTDAHQNWWIITPVFAPNLKLQAQKTPIDPESLRGFAVGQFDLAKLLNDIHYLVNANQDIAIRLQGVAKWHPDLPLLARALPNNRPADWHSLITIQTDQASLAIDAWNLHAWHYGMTWSSALFLLINIVAMLLLSLFIMSIANYNLRLSHENMNRKQAEQALRESEKRLRAIIDTEPECVKTVDTAGNLLDMNPAGLMILEANSLEEAKQKPLIEFVLPEYQSAFIDLHHQNLQGNKGSLEFETEGLRGSRRWLETRTAPVRDASGEVTMIIGVTRDITERKIAEDNLRASETLLREAQAIAGLGSYILDFNTRQWKSSAILDELFGVAPEYPHSIEGWLALVHADERAELQAYLMNEVVGHHHFFDKEYRIIRHHDQSERWVHGLGKLEFDLQGHPIKMQGTVQDITERKLVEDELKQHRDHLEELVQQQTQQLRENEQLWRLAIESSGDGVWDWNVVSNKVTFSKRWKEMLGYAETELQDNFQSWRDGLHPDDLDMVLTHKLQPFLEGKTAHYTAEFRMRCKSGEHKWILARAMITDRSNSGKPLRVVGTHTDISDIKHMEQKALAANQAKSEFLANMSHEIRTPMNGVIGMVDVLFNTPLNERQQKMAQVIRDSAYAQLNILNDILDFSKIEAGKLEFSPEPFVLADVIENTCLLYNHHALQKQVKLSWSTADNLPAMLKGDVLRLRQILSNFISNAIKFSSGLERPGTVSVQAKLMAEKEDRIWVEFRIEDNGIGMDEATLKRLFQPFQQADASTPKRFGGTGLGLIISLRLIEMMAGELHVESQPQVGSLFNAKIPFEVVQGLTLPATVDFAQQHFDLSGLSALTREEAIRQGRLILVAEDNEINQDVIRQQLDTLGLTADIVGNGQEAFASWMTGTYALLLTDVHMPLMDGYQLTTAIRAEEAKNKSGHMPIIALTVIALKGEADKCIAVGMDNYLMKPTPLPELKAILNQWLPNGGNTVLGELITANPQAQVELPCLIPIPEQYPVWDMEALTRLVGNNPPLQRRLLEKFLDNARSQLMAMLAEQANHDLTLVTNTAHTFKAAARTVGAMQLGNLCQQIEVAGKTGNSVVCEQLKALLNDAFAAVEQAIQVALTD